MTWEKESVWQGVTLEEWMRKALKEGKDAEVIAVMRNLPVEKREKYREIWKEIKEKK